jgi:hypothetical protein
VHVSNEGDRGVTGAFSELLRLQTEFQARLAEETLHYLRRLQGAAAPAAPGTVLLPDDGTALGASGPPGSTVELRLELENRQRVHCVVTPMLGPLVSAEGVTWFPASDPTPPSTLLAPGDVRTLTLSVPLPADLPAGSYRGALVLQGFANGGVSVTIEASRPKEEKPKPKPRRTSPSAGTRRTAKKQA